MVQPRSNNNKKLLINKLLLFFILSFSTNSKGFFKMEDNENKCRICLRVKKSRKLASLFDENSKNIMKIFLLTGVKV